jgi:hypothetical protein
MAERVSTANRVLTWLSISIGAIGLLATMGNIWIYKDRQDTLRTDFDKLKADHDTKNQTFSMNDTIFASFMEQQRALNGKVERHLEDKNIHVTEEQMRNLVTAQLGPITSSVGKVEATVSAQGEAIKRIEGTTDKVLQLLQQQILQPPTRKTAVEQASN